MKTACISILGLVALTCAAQQAEFSIIDRGRDHRVWQQFSERVLPNGKALRTTNRFVEIQTGLHRLEENSWVETSPRLEFFRDGAVARQLQYQAIFSANLASAGSVDLLLADGQSRLAGHLLGISYTEGDKSVLIAEVKDCAGEIGGPEQNELLFRDAFTDYAIDVQLVLQRSRVSQNVILRQALAHPREYGLTDQAVLEVWTEWIVAPAVTKEGRAQARVVPGQAPLTDERISLGGMEFAPGYAFALGDADGKVARTRKSWEQIAGRTFIVEKIPWKQIEVEMAKLPAAAPNAALNRRLKNPGLQQAANGRVLPARRGVRAALKPIQIVRAAVPEVQVAAQTKGYVLDWELVTTSTNMVLTNNCTFYVSGAVNLTSPIFEGGVAIKYAPTNSAAINLYGTPSFLGSSYRPIVLTARDDHTVGTAIGSGTLSGYYAQKALSFATPPPVLEHLRVSHANTAIAVTEGSDYTNRHSQFVSCSRALDHADANVRLENVLMYKISNVVTGQNLTVAGSHLTVNECVQLTIGGAGNSAIYLTNSILMHVTNTGSFTFTTNYTVRSTESAQLTTVGAAAHYLPGASTWRGAGTTNIGSALLSALKSMTVDAPVVIQPNGAYANNLTLYPQARRGTGPPALGYHYSPVDFAISSLYLSNATIRVLPGTVLGTFAAQAEGYGLAIGEGAKFICEGSPTNLCRMVRYNTVQEQATTNWSPSAMFAFSTTWLDVTPRPEVSFAFTDWSVLAADTAHLFGYWYVSGMPAVVVRHSQLHGGKVYTDGNPIVFTNCLFERVSQQIFMWDSGPKSVFQNGVFVGGTLEFINIESNSVIFRDNLFDSCNLLQYLDVDNGYNGYLTNATRLTPSGANDLVLTNVTMAYQTNTFNRYYLPTNSLLINAGSVTNAGFVGLYHFTTATNQVKEAGSRLDIGWHLVALNAQNLPVDTDGDLLEDHAEDRDGDGVADAGETNWQSYDSAGGLTGTPGLQVFTPLR